MRSFILPALAALAASTFVSATADDCASVETIGNTIVEIYEATVLKTVYVTEGAYPTTTRKKHTHSTAAAVYTPPPNEYVVTITEGYAAPSSAAPAPVYAAAPVYSPPPPPPSSSGGDLGSDCVSKHNYYRAIHQVGPVTWNDTLAEFAQANTPGCVMQHTGGPYGENLAIGTNLSADEGMEMWYNECLNSGGQDTYDYSDSDFNDSTGHFTQVVWKGTQQIGCYLQNCGDNNYLMCEYYPPGNMQGAFTENVFPAS